MAKVEKIEGLCKHFPILFQMLKLGIKWTLRKITEKRHRYAATPLHLENR
jgi:hypothetical protein